MSIQKTYCSHQFLDEVLAQKKVSPPHKIAFEIMRKLSDIYINLSKEDLNSRISNNEYYKQLNKRENYSIKSCADFFQTDFSNISTNVYFATSDQVSNAKQIREQFGGLVVTNSNDIFTLERLSYRQYRPFSLAPIRERRGHNVEFEQTDSWKAVFNDISLLPLNASVVSDNFMFSERFSNRKEKSLYAIIKCLLPSSLETDFHLTIFFNNSNGQLDEKNAENIIREIHSTIGSDRLKVQIVAHTNKSDTHDREILTNYSYIYSGVGFNIIDNNGIQEVARGEIKSVFHNIAEILGPTSVKHIHTQTLCWLRKIYRREADMFGRSCYIAGDTFVNRLLD